MSEKKMSALGKALTRIAESQIPGEPARYLAIHEMGFDGASQNALATRLSEAAKRGEVHGRYRKDVKYKEWGPALKKEMDLL